MSGHLRPLRYSRFLPDDALWTHAQSVPIGNATVLIPSNEEMLIHLTAHSAIHGNNRSMWLQDIKRWVDSRRREIDWNHVVAAADRWRLTLPVLSGIKAAERELGPICPSSCHPTTHRNQNQLARPSRLVASPTRQRPPYCTRAGQRPVHTRVDIHDGVPVGGDLSRAWAYGRVVHE